MRAKLSEAAWAERGGRGAGQVGVHWAVGPAWGHGGARPCIRGAGLSVGGSDMHWSPGPMGPWAVGEARRPRGHGANKAMGKRAWSREAPN